MERLGSRRLGLVRFPYLVTSPRLFSKNCSAIPGGRLVMTTSGAAGKSTVRTLRNAVVAVRVAAREDSGVVPADRIASRVPLSTAQWIDSGGMMAAGMGDVRSW